VIDKLRSFENQCALEWNKVLKKHAVLDSEGRVTFDEEKRIVFIAGSEEQKQKDIQEVELLEIKIERHKTALSELTGVGLTPDEIASLEPILDVEA
jgi:hypothetical protein